MKKLFSLFALVAALGVVTACAQPTRTSGDPNVTAPAPSSTGTGAPATSCGGGKG